MTADLFPLNETPAYLAGAENTDSDITAHASLSFPVIDIKEKHFTRICDGEPKVILDTENPSQTADHIDVVFIKVNPYRSKVYFESPADEKNGLSPRCSSKDGKSPDAWIENPIAEDCANCPFNAFGTHKCADGTQGKGKACSDSVRTAIAWSGHLDTPCLLRIPATSAPALGKLGKELALRKVPYQAVIVRISFDPSFPTPRLIFKPIGYVNEESYKEALEQAKSECVRAIIGEIPIDNEARLAFSAELEDARRAAPKEVSPSKVTVEEAEFAIQRGLKQGAEKDETPSAPLGGIEDFDL